MKPWGWAVFGILAWVGASADMAIGATQLFGMAAPQCLATVCLAAALLVRPAGGSALGFAAGLVQAGLAGGGMMSSILAHALAGFALSMVKKAQIEDTIWGSAVMVGAAVLAIRLVQLILTTPADGVTQALLSPVSALLSGVLALPVYSLLRRSAAAQTIGFQ